MIVWNCFERGNQSWSSSLVGYFLHSKLPFKVVEPIAKRLWGNRGLIKVLLHNKGYYIFKFNSDADRDNILASGPWHFASKVIVLKPWKEGVEFAKDDCDTFPIWVKLSNIPLSYWSADGISYIASGIGKPICADEITSHFELLNFARVCIEVKASFSFPSSLNVTVLNGETLEDSIVPIEVEYQSRPPSCPTCNVFGHSPLKCPKANYQWIPKAKNVEQTPLPPNSSSPGPIANAAAASDWVTVSRGAKAGTAPLGPPSLLNNLNSFSPIASSGDILQSPGSISPVADNPLVTKLKIIDEKEGKYLKQKQRVGTENSQATKKRHKGKGKLGNSPS